MMAAIHESNISSSPGEALQEFLLDLGLQNANVCNPKLQLAALQKFPLST